MLCVFEQYIKFQGWIYLDQIIKIWSPIHTHRTKLLITVSFSLNSHKSINQLNMLIASICHTILGYVIQVKNLNYSYVNNRILSSRVIFDIADEGKRINKSTKSMPTPQQHVILVSCIEPTCNAHVLHMVWHEIFRYVTVYFFWRFFLRRKEVCLQGGYDTMNILFQEIHVQTWHRRNVLDAFGFL